MQEAWVQPLVRELRSHMGGKKKKHFPLYPQIEGLGLRRRPGGWVLTDPD